MRGLDKEMRKKLARTGARAMERLDLPSSLTADVPRLELTGNRSVYMDRHKGVLSYTTETIDVNGGAVIVRLRGKNLQIVAMTDEELRIDGVVEKVELVE